MARRIELKEAEGSLRIEFVGVLDRVALGEIAEVARVARARLGGIAVTLVLLTGTELDPECVGPLRALEGVALAPASPFLARWLLGAGRRP